MNLELGTLNLVRAVQCEQRHFRQAAVAHREDDRAEAACDVDLRFAAAGEAAQDAAADASGGGALVAPSDLPSVRVA